MSFFIRRLGELFATKGWTVGEAAVLLRERRPNLSSLMLETRPISSSKVAQFLSILASNPSVSNRELRELAAAWMHDLLIGVADATETAAAKKRVETVLKPLIDPRTWDIADES